MAQASFLSPIGPILLHADGDILTSIHIGSVDLLSSPGPLLNEAIAQLEAWFEGKLHQFDLPLSAPDTPRGAAHRAAIASIGFGETASYGMLARMIGSSPRAMGQACRRNPFPIVIPCHRVVGAGGAIGYYSGGAGVSTKLWLLDHERQHAKRKDDGYGIDD
jgi:methylated-DNA-[protein]-cysteine S-methyltransferase